MRDASGTTAWSYDKMGRVKVERRTISGITKDTVYNYNLDGTVQSITYPSDVGTGRRTVTFQQNGAGRVTSVYDDTGTQYASNITYWPSGVVKEAQYGSNIKVKNFYNKRLQPTTLSAFTITGLNTIFSRTYDFHINAGNNGNVWSMTDGLDGTDPNRPNGTVVYSYDNLNRLLSAQTTGTDCTVTPSGQTKNWGTSYDIDIWGNLQAKKPTLCTSETLTESVDARNHFTGANRYDAAGNLRENGLYTYDPENRIATAGGSAYVYDGDGARVKKTGMLYWSGVSESDATGTITADYVFLNGDRIARIEGSDVHYYLSDLLNSTSIVIDKDGNVVEESQYFPYGGEIPLVNQDSNRYKFTGKERDTETGLDYFGARYYSSGKGRWMSPDWADAPTQVPYADFGDPQSLNLYAYVGNNPTTLADADGHALDTAVDAGFLTYDVYKLYNEGFTRENVLATAADVGCVLIPFATGGGLAVRASIKAKRAAEAARAAEKAAEAARAAERTAEVTRAAERTEAVIGQTSEALTKLLTPKESSIAKAESIVSSYSDNALARSGRKAEQSIARHEELLKKATPEQQRGITNDIRKAKERLEAIQREQTRRAGK